MKGGRGAKRGIRGYTLVEVTCVMLLMGMIMAIILPAFNYVRTTSRTNALLRDLGEISTAKTQFAMVNGLATGAKVNDATDLVPTYMNGWPNGPVQGTYLANSVGIDPTFLGNNATWYTQHCTGNTADALCPL
jgi:prepilin-type N-terminal cleavage/methylation domain-containing protein